MDLSEFTLPGRLKKQSPIKSLADEIVARLEHPDDYSNIGFRFQEDGILQIREEDIQEQTIKVSVRRVYDSIRRLLLLGVPAVELGPPAYGDIPDVPLATGGKMKLSSKKAKAEQTRIEILECLLEKPDQLFRLQGLTGWLEELHKNKLLNPMIERQYKNLWITGGSPTYSYVATPDIHLHAS